MITTDAHDVTRWRDLESRLRPFVERRVRVRSDADDVLQEIFVRVHRGLPSLRDDDRLGPWAFRVARSALADHGRNAARHPLTSADAPESTSEEAESTSAGQALASYVGVFIETLGAPYREALTMTELQGLSQAEAARIAGVSLSGMKSRVQRGRQQLRAALEACCVIALDARGAVQEFERRVEGSAPTACCG